MSKILVVDDDADLAELIRTKLAAEGHEVHAIHTGDGAFEAAKKLKPEIAVLDIMLPGVTGYQICRRIRRDPELYPIAVLMLTALGEEPEVAHGLEQGADDYLTKPFKLDRLLAKLGQLSRLLDSLEQRNPTTNLPGLEALKREINHRLARGITIAACYVDILNFKPYVAAKGRGAQEKVLQTVARLFTSLFQSAGIYESYVAHVGGEHFVVLLNYEDYERFCSILVNSFDQKVKDFYTADEIAKGSIAARDKRGEEKRYPIMTLSVGVAHNEFRSLRSAQKVLEVLTQIRRKAQADGSSKVFIDRRRTDR